MKRIALFTGLAIVSAVPALAQSAEMQVYGPGTISCGTYLNDRSIRINADGWILGFWTGSNRIGENHTVGKSTDSRGIVGEVARTCRDQPSKSIFEIEKQVFDRLKMEDR